VLGDPRKHPLQTTLNVDARALAGRSGLAIATSEAYGSRKLLAQSFDLGARARCALAIAELFGLL
jgi:hypothetical protein